MLSGGVRIAETGSAKEVIAGPEAVGLVISGLVWLLNPAPVFSSEAHSKHSLASLAPHSDPTLNSFLLFLTNCPSVTDQLLCGAS